MPWAGFKPTILAIERLHTYNSEHTVGGLSNPYLMQEIFGSSKKNSYISVQHDCSWMLFVTNSIQPVRQIPYQEALDGFEDLKIEGPVICTVKYANYLVSLAEVEAMV